MNSEFIKSRSERIATTKRKSVEIIEDEVKATLDETVEVSEVAEIRIPPGNNGNILQSKSQ